MNNKGITIVELIVSFALLMIIVSGMMSIIIDVKDNYNKTSFLKKMNEFNTEVIHDIETDLIKKGFTNISNCNNSSTITSCDLNFEDGTTTNLMINLNAGTITYDDIKYQIPDFEFIQFLDSRTITFEGSNITDEFKVSITKNDSYLTIDIPYFEIKEVLMLNENNSSLDSYKASNLGFKIIHPIN